MFKSFHSGDDLWTTVTVADGLVLARSTFEYSINYRSAIIFCKPEVVLKPEDKLKALSIIIEHIIPGRWKEIRKSNIKEA